jgi:hypothetical protein
MLFGETVAVYCENRTEHTDTVRTSQETHYISATEPNRLMMLGETVTVYCENNLEHTDIVRTSQETHYVSATEPNRLMLFRKTASRRSKQLRTDPHFDITLALTGSRDSSVGIVTGTGLDGRGSIPGTKMFFFSTASGQALGPTQPMQCVSGVIPWGIKLPGREVDYSPPSRAEVLNMELQLDSPMSTRHAV